MALTAADVIGLARLARFAFATEAVERSRAELNAVLERLRILGEIEPGEEVFARAETGLRLRDDAGPADPLQQPLDQMAPSLVSGFFTVPRVITPDQQT